ncbi:hypothetical protein GCM10027047_12540 [Rhodococcus aerolatus]
MTSPAAVPSTSDPSAPVVVVTGANGLVGARVCAALAERGAAVRAVVRRAGTAPALPGVQELVGDVADAGLAATAVAGAQGVVTTVHPMGSDRETQHRVGVEATAGLARAAAAAGVERFVHVSTAAVYQRTPDTGDVDESGPLVADDAGDYPVTKRDAEAALAAVDGLTTVLLRPPMILGPGDTSVWNTLRPNAIREDEQARAAVPEQTFAWVHVDDLAALAAAVATGEVAAGTDPEQGPVAGGTTAVTVAAPPDRMRSYVETVTDALGVEPVWQDGPAWTGTLLADRARAWGWTPAVGVDEALAEVRDGLR